MFEGDSPLVSVQGQCMVVAAGELPERAFVLVYVCVSHI